MGEQTGFSDWLSTVDACALLRRSEGWLRLQASIRRLERQKVGSVVFWKRNQIEQLAAELRKKEGRNT